MSHETVLLSPLNNIFDDKYEIDFNYTLLSKCLNISHLIKESVIPKIVNLFVHRFSNGMAHLLFFFL